MIIDNFEEWTRTDINNIAKKRQELRQAMLEHFKANNLEDALVKSGIPEQTAVIFAFAGAGTRWLESLAENPGLFPSIDPKKPRGLAPVENLFPRSVIDSDTVAIATYNYYAGKGLGKGVLIYNTHLEEMLEKIIKPLGGNVEVCQQKAYERIGKTVGHGDALLQARNLWKDSKYIVYIQCNDVYSRNNAILSLFCLYMLDQEDADVAHLLPMQFVDKPNYPPKLNKDNIPIGTYQEKLTGERPPKVPGLSNVGERLYRTQDFIQMMAWIEEETEKRGSNYKWLNPENHNDEFGLDHIDAFFMKNLRARMCPILYEWEWSAAKKVTQIARFIDAQRKVYEADGFIKM